MAHNSDHLTTAGKITVLTTLLGVVTFAFIFFFSLGDQPVRHADAQRYATTSVTVLNTPPQWTNDARELVESSQSNPTNEGDVVSWVATGTDANAEDYYLLICSNSATPTPNGDAPPSCHSSATQWAVSPAASSSEQATAATTTTASTSPFAGESFDWYGWICDGNSGTPRCSTYYTQGTSTPQFQSPFEVNHRPTFSGYFDDSPTDPGSVATFYATSSDPDSSGGADTVRLWVCFEDDFNTSTDECGPGGTIASSTLEVSDPTAPYTVVVPTQDQDYEAYGFIVDEHGLESSGASQGADSTLTVNNVAPTVSSVMLNGGVTMTPDEAASTTLGFTLTYVTTDNNSCVNSASTTEVTDFVAAVYRSGVSSTTCDGTAGPYDPNNCYSSGVGTSTWNISCAPVGGTCLSPMDPTQNWECTFPLWYVADPTDGTATSTQYSTQNWLALVRAIDDDFATGTASESATGPDVGSFLAFDLDTITIPYGSLEPGSQTDPIAATTTIAATGNVGLDERLSGESMCQTYETGQPCPTSASSTIPESEQVFATSTVNYADGTSISSTTLQELELNVPKSTSTVSQATGNTFWGIRVPGTITFSGDYEGENTFIAIVGESSDW